MNRYRLHQPKQPRQVDLGQEWHFINKIDPFKIIDMAEGQWKVQFLKREDQGLLSTEYILQNCRLWRYDKTPIDIDTKTQWPRVYINQQGIPIVKKTRHRTPRFDSGYYYGLAPLETYSEDE